MPDFLDRNHIHIPGLYIKHRKQFCRVFVVSSSPRVSRKATGIEQQAAVTNSTCFTLDSLNTPPVINNEVVFVPIPERKRDQITRLDECGEYFRLREGSFFSRLH